MKGKQKETTKVLTPTVMASNQVLKPVAQTSNTPMKSGECEVAVLKDGVETGETFICSVRMWDRNYSKEVNKFKLKKKS